MISKETSWSGTRPVNVPINSKGISCEHLKLKMIKYPQVMNVGPHYPGPIQFPTYLEWVLSGTSLQMYRKNGAPIINS